MSIVRQLSGETELARLQGTKMTSLFTKVKTNVVLTNKRVYQEIAEGSQKESSIIPLNNVDSFGLTASSKTWLLIIGALITLYGLYSLVSSHSKGMPLFISLIGVGLIALWWFTRKTGAVVHSMSGKTEIFVEASASNQEGITIFIARIQEAIVEIK